MIAKKIEQLLKSDAKFTLESYGDETYCLTTEDGEKDTHNWKDSLVDVEQVIKEMPIPPRMPIP